MQYSLRSGLVAVAGIGYLISGTRIFGAAVTSISIVILIVAWQAYAQITILRTGWKMPALFAVIMAAILYAGTFFSFRAFRTYEFSLALPNDPWHQVVVFSYNPTVQDFTRKAYYPLISIFPGNCHYPTGKELERVNTDPVTGERYNDYW